MRTGLAYKLGRILGPLRPSLVAFYDDAHGKVLRFVLWLLVLQLVWLFLIPVMQVIWWLSKDRWQPVPLGAIFLSSKGQESLLVGAPGDYNPLLIVPSYGPAFSVEGVAHSVAGNALGFERIMRWVLDLPLFGVAFVLLCVITVVMGINKPRPR
jgi:hypothetical protein